MYINKVTLYGNLTRDPEVKALPSGIKVASLALATNRTWKDKDGRKQEAVEYHNVVVFGKQAELIEQYMKKGNPLYIEGRLQTRSWDAQDGQKKYRTEIIVDSFQFGPKGMTTGSSSYTAPASNTSSASNNTKQQDDDVPIEYPEEEINVEDIPF